MIYFSGFGKMRQRSRHGDTLEIDSYRAKWLVHATPCDTTTAARINEVCWLYASEIDYVIISGWPLYINSDGTQFYTTKKKKREKELNHVELLDAM